MANNLVPTDGLELDLGTAEKPWRKVIARSADIDTITGDLTGNVTASLVDVKSGSNTAVNTLQRETSYNVDDIVYTSELNTRYYLLCVTAGTTASTLPSFSGAESNTQITDGTVVWRVQTVTSQEKAAGFPVGFEYFSMNPNISQGSLPLLGGEYSRETYSALWAWVQTQSGYLKTESEWQTLSASNNGNVPYYSDGDGSTTFRVPSLHCWVKGSDGSAQLVGSYLAAGLPNITGEGNITSANAQFAFGDASGALNYKTPTPTIGLIQYAGSQATSNYGYILTIDASRSSSIYGNSNTVQPESIVGMWLVKAYGTIVDTGTIDEQAYIDDRFNASKQYTDTQVGSVKSTQLAGLKFYTWRGNLTSDVGGNIQNQAPLNTIPLPSQGLRLFTANIVNLANNQNHNSLPWVYDNDHWIISVLNGGTPVPNYTAEFVLTWAVEE